MTVKELIKELQGLPEEVLDQEVLTFCDSKKPEFQCYDKVMFVDYDHLWYSENERKCPVIHVD